MPRKLSFITLIAFMNAVVRVQGFRICAVSTRRQFIPRSACQTTATHFLHKQKALPLARLPTIPFVTQKALFSSTESPEDDVLKPGDEIQVEVVSFGPLGASVDVIGISHDPDKLIPETDPPIAQGLILQKEIQYFREGRGNVDVVRGEVLPAYVERVRDTGKVDVGLRAFGGKAKADQVSKMILDRLEWIQGGVLPVGDKSPPEEIANEFPGVSKGSFKKAVASLYRQGKVQPGPYTVTLTKLLDKKDDSAGS